MQYEEYEKRMRAQKRQPVPREDYGKLVEAGYMALGSIDKDDYCALPDNVMAAASWAARVAAAMREALKSVAAWLLERFGNPADPDHDKAEGFYILTTGVLAAPPRNCDVGTAVEQAELFKAFCLPRVGKCSENSSCPAKHPCNQIGIQFCQLKWAQLPYEAEGGAE